MGAEFGPEPVRGGGGFGVAGLDLAEREAGAQHPAAVMGGEIGEGNLGAAVGGGGIVEGEGVAVAREDQDDLAGLHFGQSGQRAKGGIVIERDGIAGAAEGGGEVIETGPVGRAGEGEEVDDI